MATPTLAGEGLVLRPLVEADRPRLLEILAQPDVHRWWGAQSPEQNVDDFMNDDEVVAFAIDIDGTLAGSIQYSEETDPDYRHASIDLFLTGTAQGHGYGPEAIRTLARHLFGPRGHHRITIDPAAANDRAIRAYERVGFKPVGIMRNYERGPDGTWHDSLLMDLLPDELLAG